MDNENDAIKHQLYDLFFAWRNKETILGTEVEDHQDPHKSTALSFVDLHQSRLADRLEK
jgi:hypothetical protein